MRKLILVLLIMIIAVPVFAKDRIKVQVCFKKGIFECPQGDEVVEWNVDGGNTYEHICKDGTWLNSFIAYNGVISYSEKEYEVLKAEDLITDKANKMSAWLTKKRNPPLYIEPSVEELESMKSDLIEQIAALEREIYAKSIIIIDK